MIYTTTMPKELSRIFVPEHFIKVSGNNENIVNDPNPVFIYDQHDFYLRNTPFDKFLPEDLWSFFKETPAAKILIYFPDEFLHYRDLENYAGTIKSRNLDPSKIYFLVLDKNFEDFVVRKFAEQGITGINIQHLNMLLHKVDIDESDTAVNENTPVKKFSSLSRNFNAWRLHLFSDLASDNTLTDFTYSFHNIYPYGAPGMFNTCTEHDKKEFPELLQSVNFNNLNKNVESWIEGIPYDVGDKFTKMSTVTYDTICKADFHLLVESHYDLYLNDRGMRYIISVENFAPSFPTEKTYKAIACLKPFIAFTTPLFMKELKNLGYKTFGEYIDESYDLELDNFKRLQLITKEVRRICSLDDKSYNELIENCKKITAHNYKVLVNQRNNINLNDEFLFLKSNIQPRYLSNK
jgi:hypothetical protein